MKAKHSSKFEFYIVVMIAHIYIILVIASILSALPTDEKAVQKRESVVINLIKPAGSRKSNALPEVAINLIDPLAFNQDQTLNMTYDGNDEQTLDEFAEQTGEQGVASNLYELELADPNDIKYLQFQNEARPYNMDFTPQQQYYGQQPIIQPIVIPIQIPAVQQSQPIVPSNQQLPIQILLRPKTQGQGNST
ncbi:hypothetical protein ACOME3_006708 [Neoechinorhynchus agilis]